MKKIPLLLLTLVLICGVDQLWAGNDKKNQGAKSAALGGTAVMHSDLYSVFSNPAGLARLQGLQAGIYAENRFLISDLSLFAGGLALPTKSGTFGLGFTYFGGPNYNESEANLAYGRKITSKFTAGVSFNFLMLSIPEYGNRSAITFGLGGQYAITPKANIAAHIYNPMRVQLTEDENDLLPTILKFGFSYTPTDQITIQAETEKVMDKVAQFKMGVEYKVIEMLYLRGGYSSAPSQFSFGLGLDLNALKMDIAASYHPVLGYSPHFSLYYSGKKKAE